MNPFDLFRSQQPKSEDSLPEGEEGQQKTSDDSLANEPQTSTPALPKRALATIHDATVSTLIAGIRQVSTDRDREDVVRWFLNAREILQRHTSRKDAAVELYRSVDSIRLAQLISNSFAVTVRNYAASRLPLALKVAIPVTAVGLAAVGSQGVGIAGFGTALGMPVVVLLFLGAAGVTSIVEAFTRDQSIRDPLTKLLLEFVALEASRRAKKELINAMRADAMTPKRSDVPSEEKALIAKLQQMDPVDFERHVMSLFEPLGYPTGVTPRSNDFGVDGYVIHPSGIVVVQCKRYATDNPVGRPTVQQFKGVIEEQEAFRGFVVTTSRFTDDAWESASKSPRLSLIDARALAAWHQAGRASL